MPLEEVFKQLKTSRGGLSTEDAEVRLQIFGPNKLEEKPVSTAVLELAYTVNLQLVFEASKIIILEPEIELNQESIFYID